MNVRELIEELEKIEDKDLEVLYQDFYLDDLCGIHKVVLRKHENQKYYIELLCRHKKNCSALS